MPRFVRRALFVAVVALMAVPFTAIGSSAQEELPDDLTISVRKVVVGTGTGPSSVSVDCVGNADEAGEFIAVTLNFDEHGNPTTGALGFEIVDGAWVATGRNRAGGACSFAESATGGASSTSWTCAYDFEPADVPEAEQIQPPGCSTPSGAGVGPVHVEYPGEEEVFEQASLVTFTNTFTATPPPVPAAQVVAQPAFTG